MGLTILFAPFARPLRNGLRSAKNYPWPRELADLLVAEGHTVIQLGCDGEEEICSEFKKNLKHGQVLELIEKSDTFIAVDSYLQHAAWETGKRGIVLWGQSDPVIFGHDLHLNLLKDRKHLRWDQHNTYEGLACNDEAFYKPAEILDELHKFVDSRD